MNIRELAEHLMEGIHRGEIDAELPLLIFDGSGGFTQLTKESIDVIGVDNQGSEMKALCLNCDEMRLEEVSGDFDLVSAIDGMKEYLHQTARIINALKPEKEGYTIKTIAGLSAFLSQKGFLLEMVDVLGSELSVLEDLVDYDKKVKKGKYGNWIEEDENCPERKKAEESLYMNLRITPEFVEKYHAKLVAFPGELSV